MTSQLAVRTGTDAQTDEAVVMAYLAAHAMVLNSEFAAEVRWQLDAGAHTFDESQLLGEAAWVILSSGMSSHTVRVCFPSITRAFRGWKSAETIINNAVTCRRTALRSFGHPAKIDAIITFTAFVALNGFEHVRVHLFADAIGFISRFPYFGHATARHLAKNLGFPIAKPDRHLVRLAEITGYDSAQELCASISRQTGDPIGVIDLVLWRYSTLSRVFGDTFREILEGMRRYQAQHSQPPMCGTDIC